MKVFKERGSKAGSEMKWQVQMGRRYLKCTSK